MSKLFYLKAAKRPKYSWSKIACITCAELLIILNPTLALSAKKYYDASALELDGPEGEQQVDLSRFNTPGKQLPGIYHVEIYINEQSIGQHEINFVENEKGELEPEIPLSQYRKAGVKIDEIPAFADTKDDSIIVDLDKKIEGAYAKFNFKQQRVMINIPQILMKNIPSDYIDPEQWSQGLTTVFTSYDFSGAQTHDKNIGSEEGDQYLNLRNGVNLGAWRLRNYTTWSHNSSGDKWNNINTYLQKDIAKIKGKLTLGDDSTQSDVFDSLAFRGVEIASEDRMMSSRESGFAPVIRGIANTANAQVTVSQGGYVVYQAYVPAGPFEITDLFPSTGGGDLDVTVKEADGSERKFTQSFGSVPVMQREGHLKYEVMAGKYNNDSGSSQDPNVALITGLYGLPHDMTVYGGITNSEKYTAQQLGYGLGLGSFGSVSVDATHSETRTDGKVFSGESYRLKYAKSLNSTGTQINLSAILFPDKDYYSFEDALDIISNDSNSSSDQKHNRYEVSFSQPLKDYGSISVYAYRQNYWDQEPDNYFSVSYSGSYGATTLSINYNYTQSENGKPDKQLALNLQVPLESLLPQTWATYSMTSDSSNHITQTAGINGTLLEDNNLNYGINSTVGNDSDGGSINAVYKGASAELTSNYSESLSNRRLSYGIRGAILAHPYGVTLSQPLSSDAPIALVRIPDQENISITNGVGIKTDSRGYAVVPNIQPYRVNAIGLDTDSLGSNLEIATTMNNVIPTDGALVLADFNVRTGERVLMTLSRPDNHEIPFGATATAGENSSNSIVADNGLVYLIGMPKKGIVTVKWGDEEDEQCKAAFELPDLPKDSKVKKFSMVEVNGLCV
jgi:outer membrane usher protein